MLKMMSRVAPLYWREAATLIVTASDGSKNNDSFDVLMLQRDEASSFMPNAFVFPGGVSASDDFDRSRWEPIFKNVSGVSMNDLSQALHVNGSRPGMLNWQSSDNRMLGPDVGFRICALRETFEESGLLLVSHKNSFPSDISTSLPRTKVPPMHVMPPEFDVKQWRRKVSSDASHFSTLCEEFGVVPNIWALYEWSNWLTPVMRKVEKPPKKPQRFDTMFYVCCLDQRPEGAEACAEETKNAAWRSPEEWQTTYLDGSAKMFGPQVYETLKLAKFHNHQLLNTYVQLRERLGMIRYLPIIILGEDEPFMILPGDELFPEEPDAEGKHELLQVSGSAAEFTKPKPGIKMHRSPRGEKTYLCSVKLPCGLLAPEHVGPSRGPETILSEITTNKL